MRVGAVKVALEPGEGRTRLEARTMVSQRGEEENERSAYCGGFVDRVESLKELRMSKTVRTPGRGKSCGT